MTWELSWQYDCTSNLAREFWICNVGDGIIESEFTFANNSLLGLGAFVWACVGPADVCFCLLSIVSFHKNSSGDEIANVNFLRRYRTYVLQNTKKENLLRLTN